MEIVIRFTEKDIMKAIEKATKAVKKRKKKKGGQ